MTTTGREPALSGDSDITGREPGLGRELSQKNLRNIPLTSWDDQRVRWSGVRPILLTLTMPSFMGGRDWFRGMDHPLVMAMHGVQNQAIIQLSLSPYLGLFLKVLTIRGSTGPLDYGPSVERIRLEIGYEITLQGQIAELDFVHNFREDIGIPPRQVLSEDVRISFRYLTPLSPSPYFSPLID